jgi:hypothetical protein
MKGSTLPPHDFLLYMPEHFCASSRFWRGLARKLLRRSAGAYQSDVDGGDGGDGREQQQRDRAQPLLLHVAT